MFKLVDLIDVLGFCFIELEHMTMQYWATSASCFGVLLFIYIVMRCAPKATTRRGGEFTVFDAICLFCMISVAATCFVSLASISLTGSSDKVYIFFFLSFEVFVPANGFHMLAGCVSYRVQHCS